MGGSFPNGWHSKKCKSSRLKKRKAAKSTVKALNKYMTEEWQEIQRKNPPTLERWKRFIQFYKGALEKNYSKVQHIEIPVGSPNPIYYLFYTTRNKTGKKIMEGILAEERRKGIRPLEKFL